MLGLSVMLGHAYQVGSRLRGRVRTDSYSLIQQHIKRGAELTKLVQSGASYASATDAMRRQAEARLHPLHQHTLQHGHSAPTLTLRGNRGCGGGNGGGGNDGGRCSRSSSGGCSGGGVGNWGERGEREREEAEERAASLPCSRKAAGTHEGHGVQEQRKVGARDSSKAIVEATAVRGGPEPKGGMADRQSAWPTSSAVMGYQDMSRDGRRSRASQVLMERAISNCRPQISPAPTHASCGPAPTRFTPSRLQPPEPQLLQPSASAPGLGMADVALRAMAEERDTSRGERPNPVSRVGFAPIYYRRGATAPLAVSQADLRRLIAQQGRARESGPRYGGYNCTVESVERDEVGRLPLSRGENERLSTPQAFRLKVRKCEYIYMQQLHHKKLESAISAFDEERPQTRAFRTAAVGTALELPAAQQLAQHALPTMRLQASTIHAEHARLRTERDKRRGGVSFSRGRQKR